MGRDIHIWLEQKRPAYYQVDRWELLASDVRVVRDYSLFHVLARIDEDLSDLSSLGEPRGLPAGITPETAREVDQWGTDGHSHSFVTYDELLLAQQLYSGVREKKYVEFAGTRRDAPLDALWHLLGRSLPPGFDPALTPVRPSSDPDLLIAARVDSVPAGPNVDLAAIIAYLGVYHNKGHFTRMVFWFDN